MTNAETVNLFRMFGNGTQQLDRVESDLAEEMASLDGDYYASRGGLLFAAVLCRSEGIPSFYPLTDFDPTKEQRRAAIEESQAVHG